MRPALQRLLARPSSLGLLRANIQGSPSVLLASCQQCHQSRSRRNYASVDTERATFEISWAATEPSSTSIKPRRPQHQTSIKDFSDVDTSDYKAILNWLKEAKQLKNGPIVKGVKRPSTAALRNGWDALAKLLATDSTNVEAVWRLLQASGQLTLPHPGSYYVPGRHLDRTKTSGTATLWIAFLEMGFKEPKMMEEIHQYITNKYVGPRQFSGLHLFVLEHLLLNEQSAKAIHWYDVLSRYEQASSEQFGQLLGRLILDKSGNVDFAALKEIYIRSRIRDAYQWIIPGLIHREAFYDAFEWHMFLKDHGDNSPSKSMSRPLIQHFSRIEDNEPHVVPRGLKAGNVLASRLETRGSDLEVVERVVKLARGDSVNIDKQGPRDNWIAHLLATKWVKLDISINTVHALGVDTLGPLSLQAIALREPCAANIAKRIDQLQQRGISISNRAYSRALASFARRGQDELLQSLLESDQHPQSFENPGLQRELIRRHEAAGDWQHAKLLRAIQLLSAVDPVVESHNVQLQDNAKSHDLAAVIRTLETMRIKRIPVEVASIWRILKSVLRPRLPGHRPDLLDLSYDKDDNELAISILKNIMAYGSYVPARAWKEVTCRLGMVGRIDELHSISMWLADAYNPRKLSVDAPDLTQDSLITAVDLDSSNDLHPLRILFGDIRQRSIIEWSFIHGMTSFSSSMRDNVELAQMIPRHQLKAKAIKRMMAGVYFLKQLAKHGVYIKESNVQRACYERLVILYGPGVSSKVYNRAVRAYNPVTLPELVDAIEHAWGRQLWPNIGLLERQIQNENDWDAIPAEAERLPIRMAWNDQKPQLR